METAREDFVAAQILHEREIHSLACFHAQQAAEKALKAVWYLEDEEPWGHSITRLIREFPHKDAIEDLELWQEAGRLLDQFYIPTRYPNGLPDLTPGQVYRKVDAVQAISAAQTLIDACTDWLNRSEL
ncbi:MAG: HEPN domain-containing protein [Chloroflexi bacterium]|nr:HEPN domain-containing protein [Chloroflexota bacterium]